ncbi:MAG TPA: 2-isopropylmalate synthase [Lachnospiraceae bacterium]|nr:2-isopropylmalate synthase [Lachnospiraceae bacterium]
MRKIHVFDTTLRDGEQVPGAKLNLKEKLSIARQLDKLKVDFMEVGFPSSSEGDFESVKAISKIVKNSTIVGLGRAVESDIDAIYGSIRYAQDPMIHIVLGTSNVHMSKKFKKSPEEVLAMGVSAVKYAKRYMEQVQYSLEDASRSDFEYIWKTIEEIVKAGATCINIPDTVGYAVPEQFGELIHKVHDRLMNVNPTVLLSVHCHNDTGLATANTLAAVRNGANKVECTINGIGERAGNTSLEEVVMGIKLHPEYYDGFTDINTSVIYDTSRLVSRTMGLDVQVNKALVGENAFAHSSGIHQDGLLKSKDVYEIFTPDEIGAPPMEIVLTARSGKHAFSYVANRLGYIIPDEKLEEIHRTFLKLADQKKEFYDNDVIDMLDQQEVVTRGKGKNLWKLKDFQMNVNTVLPSASVLLQYGDEEVRCADCGSGAIDALYTVIIKAVKKEIQLVDYRIQSLGREKESLGKVVVQIEYKNRFYYGKAIENDVMKASALALINSINKIHMQTVD